MNKKEFKNFSKLNISEARRQDKFNSFKKWLRVFVVLFVAFLVFIYGWKFVVKPNLIDRNVNGFLVSAGNDSDVILEKMEKGFCLLNRRNLSLYREDGTKFRVFDFNFEKPAVHCCKRLALVYDKNGKFCNLFNFEKNLCSVVCDDNIMFAKVAENGNFAVVTQSDDFFTKLIAFDKDGKQLFSFNLAENLIVDFDFFKSGGGCFVCSLGVLESGFEKAVVYGLDFNKNKEISKYVLEDCVPVSLRALGSGFGLVCFGGLFLFDGNCGLVKGLQFDDDWNSFCVGENGYFAFSFANRVVVYDRFANMLGKFEFHEMVQKIKIDGKRIFILFDGKLLVCNLNLKILKTVDLSKNAFDFFCRGKYGYFLFDGKVGKLRVS